MEILAFLRYWVLVLPLARREIAWWHARALEAPNPLERHVAVRKLETERRIVESVALFALLAPDWRQGVRRIVRFELAYELLDGLTEHSSFEDSMHLFEPLTRAVSARSTVLAERVRQIAEAQSLNHAGGDLQTWGEAFAPDLSWWEAAAAGICSLGVLAMLSTSPDTHQQIRDAYVPVDALAALLDALVDYPNDRQAANRNWLEHYPSERAAAESIENLIRRVLGETAQLPRPGFHRLVIVGLLSHTLAEPGTHLPNIRLRIAAASRLVPVGARILRARHIPAPGSSGSCSIHRVLYRTEHLWEDASRDDAAATNTSRRRG